MMYFYSSSEFVSSGHPDRLADNIAAQIIGDIHQKDGFNSHAAIEVFLTHDSVIIGGEATTTLKLDKSYLKAAVSKAFDQSGYIPLMRKYWDKNEVVLAKDLKIVNKVCGQSPDIALGTTDKAEESGWNDQGVYFSSSEVTTPNHLGAPMYFATAIGEYLQEYSRESIERGLDVILGPDNKCVVTCKVKDDGFTPVEITAITVAVAHSSSTSIDSVRDFVKAHVTELINNLQDSVKCPISSDCQWVINGTGRFIVHGCISDTSMTGRKISVNHPSAGPVWANKMIGGGSLVKPYMHASDFLLNVAARFVANVVCTAKLSTHAEVGVAGAIGVTGLQSIFIAGDSSFNKISDSVCSFFKNEIEWSPKGLVKLFGLCSEYFIFSNVVNRNFFGDFASQPWENPELLKIYADKLNQFLTSQKG